METDKEAEEKHRSEWLEAEYATMGWEKTLTPEHYEEVKTWLKAYYCDSETAKEVDYFATKICQLFPKPEPKPNEQELVENLKAIFLDGRTDLVGTVLKEAGYTKPLPVHSASSGQVDGEIRERLLLTPKEVMAILRCAFTFSIPKGSFDAITNAVQAQLDKVLSDPAIRKALEQSQTRPKIVCLCGSTRFGEAFQKAQLEKTLAGEIVLTIGCNMRNDTQIFGGLPESELKEIKTKLDELHKRKIDLCDYVFILNVGNYIGDSTKSEIAYAKKIGKPVSYLEPIPEV